MYQVRGKVSFTGGPAPHGGIETVCFQPTKDSTAEVRRQASGLIEADGSFMLSTRMYGDGVNAGEYAVVFSISKGPMDPRSLIPAKYTDANPPPYTVKVDHDITDADFTIDLSAGAGGK